ncbi:MAG: hypothetical protein WDW36_002638 [Sanguina aurantia]
MGKTRGAFSSTAADGGPPETPGTVKRKRLAAAEAGRPTEAEDDTACVMDSQVASGPTHGKGTAAPAPSAAADPARPAKRQAAGHSDRPISSPAPSPLQAAPQGNADSTLPGPTGASGHALPVRHGVRKFAQFRSPGHSLGVREEPTRMAVMLSPPIPAPGAQKPPKQTQLNVRTLGTAGHLIDITLHNFMCHENFVIPLGNHITFIVGENGSGKSAVMQGLQFCLGSSARGTGRASKMNQLIRTGATDALVSVRLYNTDTSKTKQGLASPYEHKIYGNTITIERRITKTAAPYKVIAANGKTISTRKDDVEKILNWFNINASNPLTIITQERAKLFLAGSDKQEKFDMFMEGTLLQETLTHLQHVGNTLETAQADTNDNKAKQQVDQQELVELKRRLDKLTELGSAKEEVAHLLTASHWAMVAAVDSTIEALRRQLAEAQTANSSTELERLEQQLEAVKAKCEAAGNLQSSTMERIAEVGNNAKALKQKLRAAKNKVMQSRSEVDKSMATVEAIERDKQGVQDELDGNMHGKDERTNQRRQEHEQYMALLAEKQKNVADCMAVQETKQAQLNDLHALLDVKTKEERECTKEVQNRIAKVQKSEQELRNVQVEEQDRAFAFGGQTAVRVLQLIDQNIGRFRNRPIGPLGREMDLLDPQWSVALEVLLKASMEDYICDTPAEARTLSDLCQRAGLHAVRVHSSGFHHAPHPVQPHHRPPPHFTTVADVLKFGTALPAATVISNFLIDRHHIERVILVETWNQARDIAYNKASNFTTAYDRTGFLACGGDVELFRNNPERGVPRLGLSNAEKLRQTAEMLSRDQGSLAVKQQEQRRVRGELGALQQQCSDARVASDRARGARHHAESAFASTQRNQVSAVDEDEDQARETELYTQVEECTKHIAANQLNLKGLQQLLDRDKEKAALLEQETATERTVNLHHADQINKQAAELLAAREEQAAVAAKRDRAQQEAAQARQTMSSRAKELEEALAMRIEAFQTALQQCPEAEGKLSVQWTQGMARRRVQASIPSKRNHPDFADFDEHQWKEWVDCEVKKHMQSTEILVQWTRRTKKISEIERENGGDASTVEKLYLERKVQVEKFSQLLRNNREKSKKLGAAFEERRTKYEEMRDTVMLGCNKVFAKLLARRLHRGHIYLDMERKRLVLKVQVLGVGPFVSDLKQLSGGERSFTTVCFLLALGYWAESPFRCMDEYDVFMDAITRRIATETLYEYAIDYSDKQYILLTPQDTQALMDARKELEIKRKAPLPDPFIKVVKMQAPREKGV